jgi:hypothetical protein
VRACGRADNTMVNRKRTNIQTLIYKTLKIKNLGKLKIKQHVTESRLGVN